MPKDRSNSYLPSDRSRDSPYSRTSKKTDQCISKNNLQSVVDERDWEEARCAICMEHPHNAVLLLCSSHQKGCRPYMCDTSYRHSYCLEQFRKSSPSIQTTEHREDILISRNKNIIYLENKLQCPLCRGKISGWMVVEAARTFMNSKPRNCSLENCKFIGTYSNLRKHARRDHPSVRPTAANPTRQKEWTRLEDETTFQDLSSLNEMRDFEDISPFGIGQREDDSEGAIAGVTIYEGNCL